MSQTIKNGSVYYESGGEHKYSGWYYCFYRNAFYRWTEYVQGLAKFDTANAIL